MSWVHVPAVDPETGEAEVLALDALKAHLRMDHDEEDEVIGIYLDAAVERAETVCRRAIAPGSYELILDRLPAAGAAIELPHPPRAAVAIESVRYTSPGGEAATVDAGAYRLIEERGDALPAELVPPYGASWPKGRTERGAVRIRFTAAYDEGRAIPRGIAAFLCAHTAHQNENREGAPPAALDNLLGHYRLLRF
jgi:uncharacterized phiE125 gp8 family phage protein